MVDCGVRGSALSKLLYKAKVTPEPSVAELVVLLVSLIDAYLSDPLTRCKGFYP